jgi:hypothetical protein
MSNTLATKNATISELQLTAMNRKALREARKTAAKATKFVPVRVVDDDGARAQESALSRDAATYECCICCDDLPFDEGVAPCGEHFWCNACVVDAFNVALNDTAAFPAQCCHRLLLRAVEYLLTPESIAAYKKKTKEYYTPRVLRVYCAKGDCREFISVNKFENEYGSQSTVAPCGCGTKACVGCKQEWEDVQHRCKDVNEPGTKPDWMPPYSSDCRIKQCPGCHL